jgi:hypothetical protein
MDEARDDEATGDDVTEPQSRQITDHQLEIFLEALAESCHVRASAAVAGFAPSAAYKLRRRDPSFAEAWQAALESGYARLEMALIERAIQTIEVAHDDNPDAIPVVGTMTVAQAIDLMNKHRASIEGGRAKRVRLNARNRPTAEETDAEILRRIAILEQQREREREAEKEAE